MAQSGEHRTLLVLGNTGTGEGLRDTCTHVTGDVSNEWQRIGT